MKYKIYLSQLPTLRKWALAGSEDVILVYHYMQDKWRPVHPIALNPADPSWDLRQFLTFGTAEDALKSTGYFGRDGPHPHLKKHSHGSGGLLGTQSIWGTGPEIGCGWKQLNAESTTRSTVVSTGGFTNTD